MTNYTKFCILLCLLWLCPFIVTSFFNQPAIDDYWNADVVKHDGIWSAAEYFYRTVSARYVSLFIMSAGNTLPNQEVWIFKLWPICILLILVFSFYFFYASLFDEAQSKTKILSLSLLSLVVYVAGMRSLFEDLYWMSSTVCYQLAIAIFAIAAGALIQNMKSPAKPAKVIALIASCLLPGTVEVVIPVYILLLFILLYVAAKQKLNTTLLVYCLIITSVLSFLLFTTSGSHARIESNHSFYNQSWQKALYYSIRSAGYYVILWLINPLIIAAMLLLLLSSYNLSLPKCFTAPFTTGRYAAIFAFILAAGIVIYFPLHLFESSLPFPRVTTIFFFIFLMTGVILPLFIFTNHPVHTFFSKYLAKSRYPKPILMGLFFLFAFTGKNFLSVSKDLLDGSVAQYNTESYRRYSAIRSCKEDTCYVSPYTVWPTFAQSSGEESTAPVYFQHMNEYFKKTILLRKR